MEYEHLPPHTRARLRLLYVQVLLRPEGEEAWTSVSWELVKRDDMWLTERIWVVDV